MFCTLAGAHITSRKLVQEAECTLMMPGARYILCSTPEINKSDSKEKTKLRQEEQPESTDSSCTIDLKAAGMKYGHLWNWVIYCIWLFTSRTVRTFTFTQPFHRTFYLLMELTVIQIRTDRTSARHDLKHILYLQNIISASEFCIFVFQQILEEQVLAPELLYG